MTVNKDQLKHLKERINAAQHRANSKRWEISNKDEPEPIEVRRARDVIKRYEKVTARKKEAKIKRAGLDRTTVEKAIRETSEKFLFSTPEQALKAVVELENKYPVFASDDN